MEIINYNLNGGKMERLQKAIATSGYCSRRKAEELIRKGRVSVNGQVITEMGFSVESTDMIVVDGNTLNKQQKVYYLLNKPRGVVTTVRDDKHRKTVVDFIQTTERIYPVGRLDYDTTGVLLLTNDGQLANLLMHPSCQVEKVYIAKIEGIMNAKAIHGLKKGVWIDTYKTAPAKVKVRSCDYKKNTSIVEITIHEGKNHQVKRMFEEVGYTVLKLKRERLLFLTTMGLKPGEYRKLNPKEVKQLYGIVKEKGKRS